MKKNTNVFLLFPSLWTCTFLLVKTNNFRPGWSFCALVRGLILCGDSGIFGIDRFELLPCLLTAHDTPAKQQALCALHLTDLIR